MERRKVLFDAQTGIRKWCGSDPSQPWDLLPGWSLLERGQGVGLERSKPMFGEREGVGGRSEKDRKHRSSRWERLLVSIGQCASFADFASNEAILPRRFWRKEGELKPIVSVKK